MRAISWFIRSSMFWSAAAIPANLLSSSFLFRRMTISAFRLLMRCSYMPSRRLTSLAFSSSICVSRAVSSRNSRIIISFSRSRTSSRDFSPERRLASVASPCMPSRVGASITSFAVTIIVSFPGVSFVTVIVRPSASSLARYLATHTEAVAASVAAVAALDVLTHCTAHAAIKAPKPYVSADASVAGVLTHPPPSFCHSACAQNVA